MSFLPKKSSPTHPRQVTFTPSDLRFIATFPAPPGVITSSSRLTTGIGASGESLFDVPKK